MIRKIKDVIKRRKLYNKISECYTSCQYLGIATFGLCDAKGKPTKICTQCCPHYVDSSVFTKG